VPERAVGKAERPYRRSVSPPPIIANALLSASACAIVLVPAANRLSSKTPIGRLQKMVFAPAMVAANSRAVSGPMSGPILADGIAFDRTTSAAASAARLLAATMSTGSSRSMPDAAAFSR
jgi:hypothetical protein